MKRALSVLLVLSLLVPLGLQGQERSPELQALDYWVGEWTGTDTEGSMGTIVCKWLGNSFVQCEGDSPDGPVLWVMGYDATEGAYTTAFFFGNGENGAFDTVTLQDGTMTWLINIPTGGQFRGTWVLESQDVMTYKGEVAEEGGDYVVQAELRVTRIK
jgi:hypothetical protein